MPRRVLLLPRAALHTDLCPPVSSMGGALGAGAYFAENASYSNAYSKMPPHAAVAGPAPGYPGGRPVQVTHVHADAAGAELELRPPPGQLLMIVARVALGRTGAASSQARIAPPGFQSVGDGASTRRSAIFAVFDNYAAYPSWVLQYDPALVQPGGASL